MRQLSDLLAPTRTDTVTITDAVTDTVSDTGTALAVSSPHRP